MPKRGITRCPKHSKVSCSKSMLPNKTQELNISPNTDGYDSQPRKNGYAGDSTDQNPQGCTSPTGQIIAAQTARAYNSSKETFQTQGATGSLNRATADNTTVQVNSMVANGAIQNNGLSSNGNAAYYQQYYNFSNPPVSAEYLQQSIWNMNPFIQLKQGGNYSPMKNQVVWSSTIPFEQQYSQTKELNDWNEKQQFSVGGNSANLNYLNQGTVGQQQQIWSQIQNQTSGQKNSSCLTNPIELAMQVEPKARIRGGGGSGCCVRHDSQQQGKGCQMCITGQQPAQKQCCSGSDDQEALQADGFAVGSSSGGIPEMPMNAPNMCPPRRPKNLPVCIDPCQAGVDSFEPQPSHSGIEVPSRTISSNVQQVSSTAKANKSSRFEFSSPDSLRTKLQEYIHNRPMGPTPVGKLKPFLGAREDALSCRTCYTPDDENTLPAACQPCGRLEMTAQDFENEELAAKKKIDDAKALAEKEKTMAEVACYKSIMPMDFTCTEQLQYMKCMGASNKAIRAFRDMQGEQAEKKNSNCTSNNAVKEEFLQELQHFKNTPLPDPNYRKKVLSRQVMPPSQRRRSSNPDGSTVMSDLITPITEENEHSQSDKSSSSTTPDGLHKLFEQCRNELSSANPNVVNGFKQNDGMEDVVEQNSRLFKLLSSSQVDGTTRRITDECEMPPHSGDGDQPKKVVQPEEEETANERKMLLRQYPMFGPQEKEPERGLKETMTLYKEHLANIRKRYFGEVVKSIDEVENITPEIAAAMVFSEEEGYRMIKAPEKIYDYLYPESPSQPLVTIADVTKDLPSGFEDIVVPLIPPMQLISSEFPGLEDPAMLDSPRVIQVGPALNLADEPMITETKKPTDIAELVTGLAETMMLDVDEDDEEGISEDVFNVKLPVTMPPHFSKIQMRGSTAPNWFPGYYLALQTKPDVSVYSSHGSVLEKVWEDVQPDLVRPAAGAVVIGE